MKNGRVIKFQGFLSHERAALGTRNISGNFAERMPLCGKRAMGLHTRYANINNALLMGCDESCTNRFCRFLSSSLAKVISQMLIFCVKFLVIYFWDVTEFLKIADFKNTEDSQKHRLKFLSTRHEWTKRERLRNDLGIQKLIKFPCTCYLIISVYSKVPPLRNSFQ